MFNARLIQRRHFWVHKIVHFACERDFCVFRNHTYTIYIWLEYCTTYTIWLEYCTIRRIVQYSSHSKFLKKFEIMHLLYKNQTFSTFSTQHCTICMISSLCTHGKCTKTYNFCTKRMISKP